MVILSKSISVMVFKLLIQIKYLQENKNIFFVFGVECEMACLTEKL